jgi:hypothetical protein
MRRTGWVPSIVPNGDDQNVYLVMDDLGRHGRVWREADAETTDLETVILDLLEGQYKNPVRVVSFNTAEKWSQDVSADVAHELRRRCDLHLRDVPSSIQDFVERHEGCQPAHIEFGAVTANRVARRFVFCQLNQSAQQQTYAQC